QAFFPTSSTAWTAARAISVSVTPVPPVVPSSVCWACFLGSCFAEGERIYEPCAGRRPGAFSRPPPHALLFLFPLLLLLFLLLIFILLFLFSCPSRRD